MNLNRVEIVNFKSLANVTIKFEPRCRILVGVNEAGKSNILKALSLLSKQRMPVKEDLRIPLPTESPISSGYIYFVFRLSANEAQEVADAVAAKTLTGTPERPIFLVGTKSVSLAEFCNSRSEGIHRVNLDDLRKFNTYWSIDNSYATVKGWKKPSSACPADFPAPGTSKNLKSFAIIDSDTIHVPSEQFVQDLKPSDINDVVGEEIIKIIKREFPDTIYWSYEEKYLLPAQINIAQFAQSPDICLPLKHMFELAGISDIPKSINDAKAQSPAQLRNLFNRVAIQTSEHLHSVWKEHKNVQIKLTPNGEFVDATVQEGDLNHYEFIRRSDGFKRFITFLILISSRVKTNALRNTLLLIDEPELSLHPSGAKYLRDELIKISEANDIAYSTHSVFMIDRERVDRHLIVGKKNERTEAVDVTESNISDEEVLYNALGASIFECLKDLNLVFEGWRDKRLFQIASKHLPKDISPLENVLIR